MARQEQDETAKYHSRRSLLVMAALGAAGVVVLGAFSGRKLISAVFRKKQPPVFLEGSIFTPKEDPRMKG